MAEFREPLTGATVTTESGAAYLRALGYEEVTASPAPAPAKNAAPAKKAAPKPNK